MQKFDRLPALPLITNDPYFSIWMPGDTFTAAEAIHWTGQKKPLTGHLVIDGRRFLFLGHSAYPAMQTVDLRVTPTQTQAVMEAAGVRLTVSFCSPLLPDDLDVLSSPVSMVDFRLESLDGAAHETALQFVASSRLCYEGEVPPPMYADAYQTGGLGTAYVGQKQQRVLGHSGDHITIDWGYLYLAAPAGRVSAAESGLEFAWEARLSAPQSAFALLGYEDIAAINYFGVPCRAWYARKGAQVPDALRRFAREHDALLRRCQALDADILAKAQAIGGEDYARIAAASWRQCIAAHKLIATPKGEMALLSKENDSNGCIGTVDVSYPSVPLFLAYCPELVNALCRPVLEFAQMPVWTEDFAPHDVGRYPHATGQVYAYRHRTGNGVVYPPLYTYPAGADIYDVRNQMPVEECGNMLIMLESAVSFGADAGLLKQYRPLLERWVRYLDAYGNDPGDQLCTDDFAGHLARNINLAAKAVVGIACYARILRRLGEEEAARAREKQAKAMAASWMERAAGPEGTRLTFSGEGWSLKYNLAWDRALGLGLLPQEFYRKETESYLPRMNVYGVPLDSRADYTKSDWQIWVASMAQDGETFRRLVAPIARYLRETGARVPFSDWYDTKSGDYVHFIARSVLGGVFMALLMK